MANPRYFTGNTFCYFFPGDPTPLDSDYPVQTMAYAPDGWFWILNNNTPNAAVWRRFEHRLGMAEAWVRFNGSDGSISDSFGVDSVHRNGTGDYTLTLTYTMPNDSFAVLATASGMGVIASLLAQTTTIVQISTSRIVAGLVVDTDPSIVSVSVYSS